MKLFIIGAASILGPWLALTQQWIGYTGASVVFAFMICGVMCIPIALCYGELSGMFKNKGGTYEYVRAAFGRGAGYWVSWTTMFSYILVTLFQVICVSTVIQYVFDLDMPVTIMLAVAIVMMVMMAVLNTRDMSFTTSLQMVLFFVLLSVGLLYVIMFFVNGDFSVENWKPLFQQGMFGHNEIAGMDSGFILAVAALVTMFYGFELIPQFASEANYPRKKVPKLMLGAILFVVIFDSLLCLAECGMNSPDPNMSNFEYISSLSEIGGMVSTTFADLYVGKWLQLAIVFANFCCMACCMIGFWMGSAHTIRDMGKTGALPVFFGKENNRGMPSTGNYFMLFIVFILTLIALSGDAWINACFSLIALGVGFTYLGVSLAFLKLRKAYPDADRPWKTPGGKVTGYMAAAAGMFMAAMMIWTIISAAMNGDYTMLFMVSAFFGVIALIRFLAKQDEKKHPERYIVDDSIFE